MLSEKPACARLNELQPVARRAPSKTLGVLLALANRLSACKSLAACWGRGDPVFTWATPSRRPNREALR